MAGTANRFFSGDGELAASACLNSPSDVVVGPDGSLFIADQLNHRIRKVDSQGIITTVAGTGARGFSGDGGPALAARFDNPIGLALGSDGSLYIADWLNDRIRRVDPQGIIHTVAGTGERGSAGEGGPAVDASLNGPKGVAVGADSSLYIADTNNNRVRRVDL